MGGHRQHNKTLRSWSIPQRMDLKGSNALDINLPMLLTAPNEVAKNVSRERSPNLLLLALDGLGALVVVKVIGIASTATLMPSLKISTKHIFAIQLTNT